VNGGQSWEQATEGPGSHGTVGLSTSPVPGTPHMFVWTSAFDGVGIGSPEWTILEIMLQNSNGWSICATAQFLVQN